MTPLDQFRAFYGLAWPNILTEYLNHHYLYSSPTAIGLVKPVGDAWWIEYVAGDIEELICHLPYWLPYLHYCRRKKYVCVQTALAINKLLPDRTVNVKDSAA